MWFDVVDKIIKKKTFIIGFHDGYGESKKSLDQLLDELERYNISDTKALSHKSDEGAKVSESYALPTCTRIIMVRANKQIVWSWSGRGLPKVNELVHLFNQIG